MQTNKNKRETVKLTQSEFWAVKKKNNSAEILKSIVARKLKIKQHQIKNIVWTNTNTIYVLYIQPTTLYPKFIKTLRIDISCKAF